MTTTTQLPSLLICPVELVGRERLSPHFVRLALAAPELADFGVEGPSYDQRIKLLIPGENGLPDLDPARWYDDWRSREESERGSLRTYTVRAVRGSGSDSVLVVDVVVHADGPTGAPGPGSRWALDAALGERVLLVGPRRGSYFGGIEFDPGEARELLLVGEESAVPAVAAILEQIGETARGAAFLEVPDAADLQQLDAPPGVKVHWLVRGEAPVGAALVPAVRAHLGLPVAVPGSSEAGEEVDPDLWETPTYSSSGADLAAAAPGDRYAWIAGEAGVVTTLRRALVRECGWQRGEVAFMGYWRQGRASD